MIKNKKIKNTLKKEKGITLIALVITIVILIILATVAISSIFGENGLIGYAERGKEESKGAYVQEARDLWIQERELAKLTGKNPKSMEDILNELKVQGTLTEQEVEDILNDANNAIKIGSKTISFKVLDYDIVEPDNIDDWLYRVEDDGTATLIGYKGKDTKVIIPNTINGMQVKKIKSDSPGTATIWDKSICSGTTNSSTFGYSPIQSTITDVIISEGIEEIGSSTFIKSVALKNISIPNTVKKIGDTVFAGCESIKNIEIPSSVNYIDGGAFKYCQTLTEITIPKSVTNMGAKVFNGIPKITVNVPFKINEKPSTWHDAWADSDVGEVIVNYKK